MRTHSTAKHTPANRTTLPVDTHRRWTDVAEELEELDAASIAHFSEIAIKQLQARSEEFVDTIIDPLTH